MISIIIPAHKEGKILSKLLATIVNSRNTDGMEVIVALSPESETHILGACPDNVQLLKCKQKGRAAQMNEASSYAKGYILVFLHADVIPPQTFLLDISRTMAQGYEAGFFSYQFDKANYWLKINASFTGKDGFFTGGGDQCLFIRKLVFERLGGFNQEQVFMEDFEFFKRMKNNEVRYTIIKNDLLVSARKYESNSYIRVNLANLLLMLLFKLGYDGRRLKLIHDKLIYPPNYG